MQFLYNKFCTSAVFLYNFTLFFIFVFSVTHSGFNEKIITHILDIVFITRLRIFLSEIDLKLVMEFMVLKFLIGQWSVGWLVVGGRWSVGKCF